MAVYAIGDLHLSNRANKPMDVFGEEWLNHAQRIAINWHTKIRPDDVVLLPGDLSWALRLAEAQDDLDWIGKLPGHKVMVRGNHDYWWNGISKVRSALPIGLYALQNDAMVLDSFAYCGTRGWMLPEHPKYTQEDEVIYLREHERLRLSLSAASEHGLPIVAMIHFPPCGPAGEATLFTDLLDEYQVSYCVYGHLHGSAHRNAFTGVRNGVTYRLVSADYLGFSPTLLIP